MEAGLAKLGGVMRWDRSGHTDRNPLRTICEKVGKSPWKHDRLLLGAVIGQLEVDCVLADPLQQEMRYLGEPRLGVAHGGGIIAVHVTKVALAFDQRIPLGKILRQANERVIDGL